MMTCPACGKENEDSALECKRCRAPLREEAPEEHPPAHAQAPVEREASSDALGTVCSRCEAYNEPGVHACTNCGDRLDAGAKAHGRSTSPHDVTPPDGSSLSAELSALALSDEEAAEAGVSGNGAEAGTASDQTPPQPFEIPAHQEHAEPAARSRVAAIAATAAGVAVGAAVGVAGSRRASEPPPAPAGKVPAARAAAPAEKFCSSCGTANPPAAKFCSDCGTPFARKAPPELRPPPAPPASVQVSPSILVDEELAESTAASLDEPPPEELPAEESLPEEPPFQATLVVEKGAGQGTRFVLAHLENSVGARGAHVELGDDPYVAPHAATLLFAEEHLAVRDEGSANGVFVKVRQQAPLEPDDLFVAGERLFRYEGATELPRTDESETPFLGAPRPLAAAVRVSEVLLAGKTGRTCHRSGPVIAIGRTGCDLNFPSDTLLAARHAEIRLGEDGSAALWDLGAGPSGVFVRVRALAKRELQAGDVLMVGQQQLRLEVG